MDKISGILPEKPRLKSETELMTPVRPGAPAFGRAEGSAEIRDKVSLSTMKNIGTTDIQKYRNPTEAKNVKIVEELSRNFFMTPSSKVKEAPISTTEELLAETSEFEPTVTSPPLSSKVESLDYYA